MLKMLAYEMLLKAWIIKHAGDIPKAIQSIDNGDELIREFGNKNKKGNQNDNSK